jgi:glyoxylase-like metal-dependent hydrolase (beta-lactamase superfamily II)
MKPALPYLPLLLLFPQISQSSSDTSIARPVSELVSVPEIPKDKGYFVTEIRDGLYWLTDGAYGTIFLVYAEGVIAIDPLPTLGQRYLKAISEVTDKPVTHVIYSHEHSDHIGAADLFPRNAIFIAHKETGAILARRKDPRRPVPTVTFDKSYSLRAGEQTLVLRYTGINHELGNIFIYAPRQKVLMLVDVVYPGFMPYKNLGIAEDVQGYIRAHTDALAYDFDVFVGGHVNRLGTRKDVETAKQFVNELSSAAASVLSALDFPSYIRAHPAPDKWNLHNEYEKELAQIVQLAPQEPLGRQ